MPIFLRPDKVPDDVVFVVIAVVFGDYNGHVEALRQVAGCPGFLAWSPPRAFRRGSASRFRHCLHCFEVELDGDHDVERVDVFSGDHLAKIVVHVLLP